MIELHARKWIRKYTASCSYPTFYQNFDIIHLALAFKEAQRTVKKLEEGNKDGTGNMEVVTRKREE